MDDAIWAAAIVCRACANGESFSKAEMLAGGGTDTPAHKGQSMPAPILRAPSPPSVSTHFMTPPAEQTICRVSDFVTADAIEVAKKSANHASTRLTMSFELRNPCIGKLSHRDQEPLPAGWALAVERDLVVFQHETSGQ